MKKPTIGVIGLKGLPAFGGAATVGENIIKRLCNEYDFFVYAISSHTNSSNQEGYKIKIFKSLPFKGMNVFLYYIKSAFNALLLKDFSFIHVHHIDGAFIIPLLKLKYKVIATSHAKTYINGKWPFFVNMFFRLNERILLKYSDIVTTVGYPLKTHYTKITRNQVFYIPNGIDLHLVPENIDHMQDTKDKDYILFSAGRIIPLKGLHLLLNALKRIQSSPPLFILGDLNQTVKYKRKIIDNSSGMKVSFKGLIKDKMLLFSYLRNAKLFIFPSLSETMSVMLLEAACLRTPIICSNIPENTSIFSESEVTFFESDNDKDLTNKILWALSHEDQLKEKVENAYMKVLRNYNWDVLADEYNEQYRKLK